MAVFVAVSAVASFPIGVAELTSAWLESAGAVVDPCFENGLSGTLRSFAVLLLALPIRRHASGAPVPVRTGEIVSGVAWRLFLFADVALCVAAAK